jgi:hypothetical protein
VSKEPAQVFISYRREDANLAFRIAEGLRDDFGPDAVFIDTHSIEAGTKWKQTINEALEKAAAVVVIISKQWSAAAHPNNESLFDDPGDPLREEIVAALSRNKFIVPVLADGAVMPSKNSLPEPLKTLVDIHATDIHSGDFEHGYRRLVAALKVGVDSLTRRHREFTREKDAARQANNYWYIFIGGAIAVAVMAGLGWLVSDWRGINRPHRGTITWATTALGEEYTMTTCDCPAAPPVIEGIVYGTLTYTTDSPICAAGLHAGKITRDGGGQLSVRLRGRAKEFLGSARNGITSLDLKESRESFTFE